MKVVDEHEMVVSEALDVTSNAEVPMVGAAFEIPPKLALIVTMPFTAVVGVYFTLHDPLESLQVTLEKTPVPSEVQMTVPGEEDAILAEQVVGVPTVTSTGLQETASVPTVTWVLAQKVPGGTPLLPSFTITEKLVVLSMAPVSSVGEVCPEIVLRQLGPVYHW
jgi:hypothetical protein